MARNSNTALAEPKKNQQTQEIARLGDGEVFVKRTPQGEIYAVKADLILREDQNEIAVIENKPTIAAEGYYRANQIASLAIITPDSVHIPWEDGSARSVPNPFPIIDQASGTQRGVWVKKVVVGYSPTGTLAISSHTMYYNFTTYFLQDLQKKVQYNQGAGRLCFEGQLTDEEKAKGIFLKIEGDFGIWANIQHQDVLKAVSTWLANKNFGERKAQTIAERNALKHHPAMALRLRNLQGAEKHCVGQITVVGWQHNHSKEELEEIASQSDSGEPIVIDGQVAQVVETAGSATEEDVHASEELDEEQAARAAEAAEAAGASGEGPAEGRLF